MNLDAAQRARLEGAKAAALVRDHGHAPEILETTTVAGAIGLRADDEAFVYLPGDGSRRLGAALLWLDRFDVSSTTVFTDEGADVLTRRVGAIAHPPAIRAVRDRDLVTVEPAPYPDTEPPSGVDDLVAVLVEHGLDVVVEHGVVTGEWHGLEVARVVADPDPRLAVGVGRFDREAGDEIHRDLSVGDRLALAVATVSEQRRPGAGLNAISRLDRARWLRSDALGDPTTVGCTDLQPVDAPVPRANLLDAHPAAAMGTNGAERCLVVFSVGVDTELVPVAADLVVREEPDEVAFVAPARDLLEPVRRLAARVAAPVRFVEVMGPWD